MRKFKQKPIMPFPETPVGESEAPKKPRGAKYRVKNGEVRRRGEGPLATGRMVLASVGMQLAAEGLTLDSDPREYLERRRLLLILGMEDIIARAREQGDLDIERHATMDLLKLTSLGANKVFGAVVSVNLKRGPNLAKMSDRELLALEAGDGTVCAKEEGKE